METAHRLYNTMQADAGPQGGLKTSENLIRHRRTYSELCGVYIPNRDYWEIKIVLLT